jgi:hypothetical protein
MITTGTLLLSGSVQGQGAPRQPIQRTPRPITAPVYSLEGTLDLATGLFTRTRSVTASDDHKQEVYDNTCSTGLYVGQLPAGPGGTGSSRAELFGDYGAIPSTQFSGGGGLGDAFCSDGCSDDYDITQFEIAWCQLAAPPTGAIIELNFWPPPNQSCVLGTALGNNPTGGVHPPATTNVISATLTGLPRNNQIGTLACYSLNVFLNSPPCTVPGGFNLLGSNTFAPGVSAGDKFAWSFTIPTTTGADGPILAGDISGGSVCTPCEGAIWQVGGQTTNQGTGAGQDGTLFAETYGGTVVPSSSDCYIFGGANPPSGLHLELFAHSPCVIPLHEYCFPGGSFCDAFDGSLASCPCGPGNAASGCDNANPPMQGGGTLGGVKMVALIQQTTPNNHATMQSTGFPTGSTPGGVLFRNNGIDPSSPVVFGDGIRCVDATASPTTFVRLGGAGAVGGTMISTFGHGAMAGTGSFFYQLWYRSTPPSFCDPMAGFNFSNGVALAW